MNCNDLGHRHLLDALLRQAAFDEFAFGSNVIVLDTLLQLSLVGPIVVLWAGVQQTVQLVQLLDRSVQQRLPFFRRSLRRFRIFQEREHLNGQVGFVIQSRADVDQRIRQLRQGPIKVRRSRLIDQVPHFGIERRSDRDPHNAMPSNPDKSRKSALRQKCNCRISPRACNSDRRNPEAMN